MTTGRTDKSRGADGQDALFALGLVLLAIGLGLVAGVGPALCVVGGVLMAVGVVGAWVRGGAR